MLSNQSKWIAYACLWAAMLLWAGSFVALKIALRSYDPIVVIFSRMALACVCFVFFRRRFQRITYRPGDWKYILFMAFCEPCLYFLFEIKAMENTSASQAGVIAAVLPLLVAVAAHFFLKEHISKRTLFGFVAAILGSIWLSLAGEATAHAPRPLLGNFLEFTAMVCAMGYIVTLKKLTSNLSPLFLTAAQAVVGFGFYLPLLFLPSTTLPTHFDPGGVMAIVYLGIFVTLGAYGLYNFGVSRIPVSQASVFINLIPVFTIFLGWLVLGEALNASQFAAVIVILAGVSLSQETL